MYRDFQNANHIEAVLDAWPGARHPGRTSAGLRDVAIDAGRELASGRTEIIDALFADMSSPRPVLRWNPTPDHIDPPQLRFLADYWDACSQGGALPLSSRIDPLDLVPVLGFVMLLEPVADGADFRYRVYGTRIVEYSRVEMTGKCVWDIPAPLVAAYFVATYCARSWTAVSRCSRIIVRNTTSGSPSGTA